MAPLKKGRDVDWEEEMDKSQYVDCVPVGAMDPVYMLYTSGTTGLPKVNLIHSAYPCKGAPLLYRLLLQTGTSFIQPTPVKGYLFHAAYSCKRVPHSFSLLLQTGSSFMQPTPVNRYLIHSAYSCKRAPHSFSLLL
jgi:acyl-CoA synthetase (AMP-forming)/AMP-acid ligase II